MRRKPIHILLCLWAAFAGHGPAFAGASWQGMPYSLAIADHVAAPGQVHSDSLTMTLAHDQVCWIAVSVVHIGDEVLRCDGDFLTTSYKLMGPSLKTQDLVWLPSETFRTQTYEVQGNGPESGITIYVRATASAERANRADTYSAAIILTVSW